MCHGFGKKSTMKFRKSTVLLQGCGRNVPQHRYGDRYAMEPEAPDKNAREHAYAQSTYVLKVSLLRVLESNFPGNSL